MANPAGYPPSRLLYNPLKLENLNTIPTWIPIGDSFVANGDGFTGNVQPPTSALNYNSGGAGFTTWVDILSDYRVKRETRVLGPTGYPGTLGRAGDTAAVIAGRLGTILQANPTIVVMPCGTNDINNSPTKASEVVDIIWTIVQTCLRKGITVIWPPIIPRPANFDATADIKAVSINNMMRKIRDTTNGLIIPDLESVMCDPTSATWAIASGMLADGVHPSALGSYIYGNEIAKIFNALFPFPRTYGMKAGQDLYAAVENPYGNLLPNGFLHGTAGSLAGGATGTVADSCTLDATLAGGAAVAGSKSTLINGSVAQQIAISGPKTGTNRVIILSQAVSGTVRDAIQVGETIQFQMSAEIGANSNISSIQAFLSSTEGGVTYGQNCGNTNSAIDTLLTTGWGRTLYLRTPARALVAPSTQMFIRCQIQLLDGSVTPSATIKVGEMSVTRV